PSPSSPPPAMRTTFCAAADAVIRRAVRTARIDARMIESPVEEDTQSAAYVQLRSLLRLRDIGDIDAQSGGQVVLVLLLLDENLADILGKGVFAEGLALPHALAVIA